MYLQLHCTEPWLCSAFAFREACAYIDVDRYSTQDETDGAVFRLSCLDLVCLVLMLVGEGAG